MTSALYNQGIKALKDLIARDFVGNGVISNGNGIVPNLRHQRCLETAFQAAQTALYGFQEIRPDELIVIDLKTAVGALDDIFGLSTNDMVIEEIFSRFCIGK